MTNNGVLTFVVPTGVPSQLFYQCEVHLTMTGRIALNGAAVASLSLALVLLAALML